MDARTPESDATPDTDQLKVGTEQKLSAYGRARRRRERIRKIVRGAIGIGVVLVLWHVMAVAYDLEQILPPPLSVARTVINTLTLNYEQRWLYGPNIYEHLMSSFARAITGFTLAAVTAGVVALLLLVHSQTARGGPSYARLVAALAAGVAVTVPYLRSVAPGADSGEAMASFGFQPYFAVGFLADLVPALVLALWFFRRANDHTDTREFLGSRLVDSLTLSGSGILLAWFILMLVVALTVDLPVNNETKFAYFAWLPLCALATGAFERKLWFSDTYVRTAGGWKYVLGQASLPLPDEK
jgi:hypothetical protein